MNELNCAIVQNLKCGGCSNMIGKTLRSLGASKVEVLISESKVCSDLDVEQMNTALAKLGYPPADGNNKNSAGFKFKSYLSCAIGKIAGKMGKLR